MYEIVRYCPERRKFYFAYVYPLTLQKLERLIERAQRRGVEWLNIQSFRVRLEYLQWLREQAKTAKPLFYRTQETQVVFAKRR